MKSIGMAVAAVAMLAAGCTGKSYRFQVPVTNSTGSVLSVGLVKTGMLQEGWDAPEDVAREAPQFGEKHWGTLIRPGETKVLGPQKGKFEENDFPFLRAYRGDKSIVDLVSMSRKSVDRLDVPIDEGMAPIVIRERNGRLVAEGRWDRK